MKKVIVTGALGFIGFAICKRLLDEGHEVFAIDSFLHSDDRQILGNKLLEIGRNANFHFEKGNALTTDFKSFAGRGDIFFDCAIDRKVSSNSIQQKMKEGKTRIKNEVEYCKEAGATYCQLSTLEVFNLKNQNYIDEKSNVNPTTTIGKLKAEEEKFLMKQEKLSYYIVRLPSVYGPYQPKDMTFQQILNGKKKPIIDFIVEDLIYIEDAIDGLIKLIEYKSYNEIIHLVSGQKKQWLNGYKLLMKKDEFELNENQNLILSSEKSKKFLNFSPKVPIKDGLSEQKNVTKRLMKLRELGLLGY